MKKILVLLPLLLLLLSCENDFKYDYFTIDDDMLRVIDFSFETTELAPGDTAVLIATFAGYTENLNVGSIEWRSSWNIITNPLGANIIVDDNPLICTEEKVDSTDHTATFRITFEIPDSIMYISEGIPEQWGDIFKYIDKSIDPSELNLPVTKTEMLQMIEMLKQNPQLIENGTIPGEMVTAVSQLFSVIFRIEARPRDGDKVLHSYGRKVYHSVRFNSWFETSPGIYQNHAPTLDSVFLYELKKGSVVSEDLMFDKSAIVGRHALVNDTIRVPAAGENDLLLVLYPRERDITMSLEQALLATKNGTTANLGDEFYELTVYDRTEGGSFSLDDRLENESNRITTYGYRVSIDPINNAVVPSTYWFRIDDGDDDVSHRPRGSAIQEITIVPSE